MTQQWQRLKSRLLDDSLSPPGQYPRQASVLALFTRQPEPALLFTLRSRHLTSHAGEVSFPGGKWEPGDLTLRDTALRETREEIGLAAECITLLGACKPRATRAGVLVTPFVGLIDHANDLCPCPFELDAIFQVPLMEFHRGIQVRIDSIPRGNRIYQVPAYQYQGYEIWGFTASLTCELLAMLQAQPAFSEMV
jgi:8-oxo-dGTP pyrophosphatase MutT (NUDIX family)